MKNVIKNDQKIFLEEQKSSQKRLKYDDCKKK